MLIKSILFDPLPTTWVFHLKHWPDFCVEVLKNDEKLLLGYKVSRPILELEFPDEDELVPKTPPIWNPSQ
jgi:hypothetical protein